MFDELTWHLYQRYARFKENTTPEIDKKLLTSDIIRVFKNICAAPVVVEPEGRFID